MAKRLYDAETIRLRRNESAKQWRGRNPERVTEARKIYYNATGRELTRCSKLKNRYGVTSEEFDSMFEKQSGLCKICKKPETMVRKGEVLSLVVDHNHVTGYVRGLLCHRCNTAIGFLRESPEVIRKAASYLESAGGVCLG